MIKLFIALLTGAIFFMGAGCNDGPDNGQNEGDILSFSNLKSGYAVGLYTTRVNNTDIGWELQFCGNEVKLVEYTTDIVIDGTFSISGNTIIMEFPRYEYLVLLEEPNGHSYFKIGNSVNIDPSYGDEFSMEVRSYGDMQCGG